jgi:hypothetical protein
MNAPPECRRVCARCEPLRVCGRFTTRRCHAPDHPRRWCNAPVRCVAGIPAHYSGAQCTCYTPYTPATRMVRRVTAARSIPATHPQRLAAGADSPAFRRRIRILAAARRIYSDCIYIIIYIMLYVYIHYNIYHRRDWGAESA